MCLRACLRVCVRRREGVPASERLALPDAPATLLAALRLLLVVLTRDQPSREAALDKVRRPPRSTATSKKSAPAARLLTDLGRD